MLFLTGNPVPVCVVFTFLFLKRPVDHFP